MFVYQKKLEYPVHIKNTNPKLAQIIISQYGGPYGVLRRSLREPLMNSCERRMKSFLSFLAGF
jgi:Mn-containing catalase